MKHALRAAVFVAALIGSALALAPAGLAQTGAAFKANDSVEGYPDRPVRLMSPFAPGGPSDAIVRSVAEALTKRWKQPVIIEYKPGGGTVVGTNYVAQAKPDGYTIGYITGALSTLPAVRARLPYDVMRDIAFISEVSSAELVLIAHADAPFDTVEEFVKAARDTDDPVRFTTPARGSQPHLFMEHFAMETGMKLQFIPYKGSAPALADVVAGRVPVMVDVWHSARPHIDAKTVKVLAVATGKRIAGQPYPTISESFPGMVLRSTQGFIAPAGTPQPIIDKISADLRDLLKTEEVGGRLKKLGFILLGTTSDEYRESVRKELEVWRAVVEKTGLRID